MATAQLCSPNGTCLRVFGKPATAMNIIAVGGAVLIVAAILYKILR